MMMAPSRTSLTQLIPAPVLGRFLRTHMSATKLLAVAVSGSHAYGYSSAQSPLELKGLHVEATENLVGLSAPPRAFNWVGEFEEHRIDYSSEELGAGLKRLLAGDGSMLERILAPRQLLKSEDLRRLQKVTRGVICRRFFAHYRAFSKGVLRDYESDEQRTVRHLLGAYRSALTGVHLLRSGKIALDLIDLAQRYGFGQIEELVALHRAQADAVVEDNNQWLNRLVRLHSLLEQALEESTLPVDPDNPRGVEEYLLDMRRRFFDATTTQQPPRRPR
jgi:predicted nucleotidyltransferase